MSGLNPFRAYADNEEGAHQPYSAYNQGYDAALVNRHVEANPYPRGSREWAWWRDGNAAGKADLDSRGGDAEAGDGGTDHGRE